MGKGKRFGQTPSQTIGPYFAYGLTPGQYGYDLGDIAGPQVADSDVEGQHVRIEGKVLDGEGKRVSDAMIEIWQPDAQGRYAHPADPRGSNAGFRGFGRVGTGTDPENRYFFETVKPGAPAEGQAPHATLVVFARGMLSHAFTRVYFPDEAEANAADPVLSSVPEDRRGTLVAERREQDGKVIYNFDIVLQGEHETVFFDL